MNISKFYVFSYKPKKKPITKIVVAKYLSSDKVLFAILNDNYYYEERKKDVYVLEHPKIVF